MIRPTTEKKLRDRTPKPRAEIAAALFAGALTLFAVADMPARAPAPTAAAAPVPAEQAPARLRTASYYPEDLAALQSLRGFQPMANEGEKPTVAPVALAPGKAAPFDPKAPHRTETKTIALPPAAAPGQAAQQPPPAPAAEPFKVFGLSLPADVGAQVNAQVINMRDTAGRWGAAAWGLAKK